MAPRKSPLAASFVGSRAARHVGGRPCLTCRDPQRAEVEAECRAYNRARKSGRTSASWARFHVILVANLGLRTRDWKSMIRHLENCLGWTIH